MMAVTVEEPPRVVVCREALDSHTLQEFVKHGKSLSGDSFGFPTTAAAGGGSAATYAYYSPEWVWDMASRAIRIYCDQHGIPIRNSNTTPLVIGFRIYASIESVITLLALIRMGHIILLIAPTLPQEHVQLLVKEASCKLVVNGTANSIYSSIPLPTKEQLLKVRTVSADGDICWTPPAESTGVSEEIAVMIHSSASSGAPKLVPKSHRSLLSTLRGLPPVFHDKTFFMGSWLHWMAGFSGILFSFVRSGARASWSREDASAHEASSATILAETRPQVVWVQPSFIYQAAETSEGIDALRRCIMVVCVGGVLASSTADRLLAAGVRLATEYGMTEVPFGLSSAASAGDARYWDYAQPDAETAPHLVFRPLGDEEGSVWAGGEQLFELVVLPTLPGMDAKKWANRADGSLHTGDVFVKHPSQERYKCLGRRSDVLEVNPTAVDCVLLLSRSYEDAVEKCHADVVDAALLAGQRRERPVLLVFVKKECRLSDQDVLNRIRATVDQCVNGHVPVPLDRDMIVVVRDEVVPRTPKGEIMRAEATYRFRYVIDRAYD
ncbi:acetyl-CoA synthetase-like protein [Rhypophila decipiens]|uniref:Acetyl-CoA synthetase-like protein n=1 Tax=Rhypophila decipiens TaxID=261697 RepID=A0AAN7BBJ7_9PEZI|nr:acetyl-CoA synthetase-like protein [Rhypophila decipiens]